MRAMASQMRSVASFSGGGCCALSFPCPGVGPLLLWSWGGERGVSVCVSVCLCACVHGGGGLSRRSRAQSNVWCPCPCFFFLAFSGLSIACASAVLSLIECFLYRMCSLCGASALLSHIRTTIDPLHTQRSCGTHRPGALESSNTLLNTNQIEHVAAPGKLKQRLDPASQRLHHRLKHRSETSGRSRRMRTRQIDPGSPARSASTCPCMAA